MNIKEILFQNDLAFGGTMEPADHTQAQSLQNRQL